jgi:hypothetical protein
MHGQSALSQSNEAWQETLAGSPLIKRILAEESDFCIGINRLLAWQFVSSEKPRLVLPVAFRQLAQGIDSGDEQQLQSSIAHFFQFLRRDAAYFASRDTFSSVDFFGLACAGQDQFLFPLQQMGLIEPVPIAPGSTELSQWTISEHLRTWILHSEPKDLFMIFADGGRGHAPHYFASMLSIDERASQASKLRYFDPQRFDREVTPQMSEPHEAFVLQCVGEYLSDEPDIKDLSQAVRVAHSCMDWVLWSLDHLEDPDAFNETASKRAPDEQAAFRLGLYQEFIALCQSKGLNHDIDGDACAFDQMMKLAYDSLIMNLQTLSFGDSLDDPLMQGIKALLDSTSAESVLEPASAAAPEPAPELRFDSDTASELDSGSEFEFDSDSGAAGSLSPRDGASMLGSGVLGAAEFDELGSDSDIASELDFDSNSEAAEPVSPRDGGGSDELDSGSDTASAPKSSTTIARRVVQGVFCLAGLGAGILSAGVFIFGPSIMPQAAPLWLSAVSLHPFISVCVGLIFMAHGLGLDRRVYQWACMQDQKTGTMRRQNIVFKLMAGVILLSAAVPMMSLVYPMPLFMPCIAVTVLCVWVSNVWGPRFIKPMQSSSMPQIASSGTPSPHAARQFHPVGQQRSSLSASQSTDGPDASASRSLSPPTV